MDKLNVLFAEELSGRYTHQSGHENQVHEEAGAASADPLFDGVFKSPEMLRAYDIASVVAPTDVPVLITGESGVGKEIFAQFIHKYSPRANNPFIRVNCAALPNDLLESELFGYERGAFTGAMVEKPGRFELATGGTILLDEIAEMSPRLQAKLLHVLQDGEFSRLGGRRSLRADARIIASTNRQLEEAVSRGEFRDDLYFRLNVIRIKIPPLRERKEEIALLSNYFVQKYREKYRSPVRELSVGIMEAFLEYDWPGNIRELENAIRRYLILPHMGIELPRTKSENLHQTAATNGAATPSTLQVPPQNFVPKTEPMKFSSLKHVGAVAAEEAQRKVVLLALEQTNWNRKQAALRLNICYKALLNRIKKWKIERPQSDRAVSRRKDATARQPLAEQFSEEQPVLQR